MKKSSAKIVSFPTTARMAAAAAAAVTTTMTTTGWLIHQHHHRYHHHHHPFPLHGQQQQQQCRFFFTKLKQTEEETETSSSSSSTMKQSGEDVELMNENSKKSNETNFIFDIEQWAKKVKAFDYEDIASPSQVLSQILPTNNVTNTSRCEEGKERKPKPKEENEESSSSFFRQFQDSVSDAFDDYWTPSSTISGKKATGDTKKRLDEDDDDSSFEDMVSSLVGLLKSRKGETSTATTISNDKKSITIEEIVSKARKMSENSGDVSDKTSLLEVFAICKRAIDILQENDNGEVDEMLEKLPMLNPSNLFYYLEYEESIKNPSFKRRKHRFYPGVDTNEVDDLNEKLRLALLSYEDNIEDIKSNLESKFDYELVYCTMESLPWKPSHFIAVKNKSKKKAPARKKKKDDDSSTFWSSSLLLNDSGGDIDNDALDMILVVRGTKSITDVITDLLCDATEYRNGCAHAGILESGKYLANKHDELFQNIIKISGKKRINLTLVGHSLGAGAASIAGMEMNDKDYMNVHVYGFGCPALVSKELSEAASSYITTIVADNDLIPRMSTATMMNAIIDIGSFNWIPYARRDIEEAIMEFQQRFQPLLLPKTTVDKILPLLDDILPDESSIPPKPPKRMGPILFPPGRIYHFYRDGFDISGNVVPCTFFNELDLSRRMVHDHLIRKGYFLIFLDVMRAQHGDHYFQFEIDKKSTS